MAISRMQEPQQIQSGIGSLQDPRQGYFLGKLVKKAGRAVKKIVKSPIGKAAMIGALGMIPFGASKASLFSRGIGALKGLGAARNMPSMLTRGMGGTPARSGLGGFLSSLNPFGGNFSGKNAFLTAGALATAAPFIANAMAPEDTITKSLPFFLNISMSFTKLFNHFSFKLPLLSTRLDDPIFNTIFFALFRYIFYKLFLLLCQSFYLKLAM